MAATAVDTLIWRGEAGRASGSELEGGSGKL